MPGIIDINNPNLGGLFKDASDAVGGLLIKLRTAITGKEPISEAKAAELAIMAQEIQNRIDQATMAVALAEASSADPWTSRSRPLFMYVVYIFILAAIPFGVLSAFLPEAAKGISEGAGTWLRSIPNEMWWLFGTGYLGYGAFRSFDKWRAR